MEDVWTHYWLLCSRPVPGPTAVWPVRFDVSAGTAEFMDARVGWPVTDLEPLPEGCR